jgi:hypothetical protein
MVARVLATLLVLSSSMSWGIDSARMAQINHALKAHGYPASTEGLKRVARDHRWQTRSVPDSRVIIFLGLGPHYKLLNAETAWPVGIYPIVAMGGK